MPVQHWLFLPKIRWRRDRLPTPVFLGFPCGSAGEESACNAGDLSLIPGLGRSPGEGKDYPLRYSGLENSTECIVHGVAKRRTQLSDFHFHLHVLGTRSALFLMTAPRSEHEQFHIPIRTQTTEADIQWEASASEFKTMVVQLQRPNPRTKASRPSGTSSHQRQRIDWPAKFHFCARDAGGYLAQGILNHLFQKQGSCLYTRNLINLQYNRFYL